jgi:ankyrin repeat protein
MKSAALSAAVRNRSRELIDLLLQHSASMSGLTHRLDIWGEEFEYSYLTTPLAEAIRSQNKDLVQEFEILGALSHLDEEKYFEAVILAAAEVGDCDYLQKILQRAPEKRRSSLTEALNVAIRNGKTEAALILIYDGADVNAKNWWPGPRPRPPLMEALQSQKKTVVEAILDADVNMNACYDQTL